MPLEKFDELSLIGLFQPPPTDELSEKISQNLRATKSMLELDVISIGDVDEKSHIEFEMRGDLSVLVHPDHDIRVSSENLTVDRVSEVEDCLINLIARIHQVGLESQIQVSGMGHASLTTDSQRTKIAAFLSKYTPSQVELRTQAVLLRVSDGVGIAVARPDEVDIILSLSTDPAKLQKGFLVGRVDEALRAIDDVILGNGK
jgi:hypothetical protein